MPRNISLFAVLLFAAGVHAQAPAPWSFSWQKGQALIYKTQHQTQVAELIDGKKTQSSSDIRVTKRWLVTDVDPMGVATLEMSIIALRHEQSKGDGKSLLFDSADLEKSTPDLRELNKFLGQIVTELRIDGQGRIWDVKKGSKVKLEADPPFSLVLPGAALQEGQAWVRKYKITLEPPAGAGEQFDAQQKYTVLKNSAGLATIDLATEIKSMPDSFQEKLPLAQKELRGQLTFDHAKGLLVSVNLLAEKTIENHQGKGSLYTFRTSFTEQLETGGILIRPASGN